MGPPEEVGKMFDFYSSHPCPAVIVPFCKTPLTSRGAGDPFVCGHRSGSAAAPHHQPHRFVPGDIPGGTGQDVGSVPAPSLSC